MKKLIKRCEDKGCEGVCSERGHLFEIDFFQKKVSRRLTRCIMASTSKPRKGKRSAAEEEVLNLEIEETMDVETNEQDGNAQVASSLFAELEEDQRRAGKTPISTGDTFRIRAPLTDEESIYVEWSYRPFNLYKQDVVDQCLDIFYMADRNNAGVLNLWMELPVSQHAQLGKKKRFVFLCAIKDDEGPDASPPVAPFRGRATFRDTVFSPEQRLRSAWTYGVFRGNNPNAPVITKSDLNGRVLKLIFVKDDKPDRLGNQYWHLLAPLLKPKSKNTAIKAGFAHLARFLHKPEWVSGNN